MGKTATYILAMGGLILLFTFTGIIGDSTNFELFNLLLRPSDFRTEDIYTQTFAVLNGIGVAGIVIGLAISKNVELAVRAVFALFLLNLLWDFIKVYNVMRNAEPVLSTLIFGPILFLFFIAIIDWMGKND